MSYFLFDGKLEVGKTANLQGNEAKHILKSRRLRFGEKFQIQDSLGLRYNGKILELQRHHLIFEVLEQIEIPPESSLHLELWIALVKEKAMDWILQKSTELGVSKILIFQGRHSPKTLHSKKVESQLQRWQRICWEACKQCGRHSPPKLEWFEDINKAWQTNAECTENWILAPNEKDDHWNHFIQNPSSEKTHRVLIGPEGGWHSEELAWADSLGIHPISLGPRILRTESASVAIASIFQFICGDLRG